MREIGKTKMASVLIALSCCTLAALSFQMHRARAADRETVLLSVADAAVGTEPTERSLRASGGSDGAISVCPVPLTCRLEDVRLAPGFHKE